VIVITRGGPERTVGPVLRTGRLASVTRVAKGVGGRKGEDGMDDVPRPGAPNDGKASLPQPGAFRPTAAGR
jgi:hypothetical protein